MDKPNPKGPLPTLFTFPRPRPLMAAYGHDARRKDDSPAKI